MSRVKNGVIQCSSDVLQVGNLLFYKHSKILINDNGEEVRLRSQSGKVLSYLLENAGDIVSKESLHEYVWGESVVTNDSLVQCIGDIRRALNDKDHTLLRTCHRKGYLLNAVGSREIEAKITAPEPIREKLKPTLAIIPPLFAGEKNSPMAIVGEIIAANLIEVITCSPLLSVISRLSTRQFSDGNTDIHTISTKLQADYILSGLYRISSSKKLELYIELSFGLESKVVHTENICAAADDWNNGKSDCIQRVAQIILDEIICHQLDLTASESTESIAFTLI